MESNKTRVIENLLRLGFLYRDAEALRRIAMTLARWHEYECGIGDDSAGYCIARETDDEDSLPHMWRHDAYGSHDLGRISDREKGARTRLAAIMARYPEFVAYIQTDPRGVPLYIVPASVENIDSNYAHGVAVYK